MADANSQVSEGSLAFSALSTLDQGITPAPMDPPSGGMQSSDDFLNSHLASIGLGEATGPPIALAPGQTSLTGGQASLPLGQASLPHGQDSLPLGHAQQTSSSAPMDTSEEMYPAGASSGAAGDISAGSRSRKLSRTIPRAGNKDAKAARSVSSRDDENKRELRNAQGLIRELRGELDKVASLREEATRRADEAEKAWEFERVQRQAATGEKTVAQRDASESYQRWREMTDEVQKMKLIIEQQYAIARDKEQYAERCKAELDEMRRTAQRIHADSVNKEQTFETTILEANRRFNEYQQDAIKQRSEFENQIALTVNETERNLQNVAYVVKLQAYINHLEGTVKTGQQS